MMRTLLCLSVVLLLATVLCAAGTPGGPIPHAAVAIEGRLPRDIAVSPSGNQLAVVTETGLHCYVLDSKGRVGRKLTSYATPPGSVFSKLAYTPNGGRIFLLADGGKGWWYDRTTKTASEVGICGKSSGALSLYVLEDPPVVFCSYASCTEIYVLNHRQPSLPVEKIPLPTGMTFATCVTARADAGMVYTAAATDYDGIFVFCGEVYRGSGQSWATNVGSRPTAACIGPGPEQLMVATRNGDLVILRQDSGLPTIGTTLNDFDPSDMAFSNDGYFAVLADGASFRLRVISGHDLRQRLEVNTALRPEQVRFAECALQSNALAVAVHPTLPIAYAFTVFGIELVDLRIPGITHPLQVP